MNHPYRIPAEMPKEKNPMSNRTYLFHLLFTALVVGIVGGMMGHGVGFHDGEKFGKSESQTSAPCPAANDFITYPDDMSKEDQPKGFSCPIRGQELEVVRDMRSANVQDYRFKTYFRCSCPKRSDQ